MILMENGIKNLFILLVTKVDLVF